MTDRPSPAGDRPSDAVAVLPRTSYASWATRVLAQAIDMVPLGVAMGIAWGVQSGADAGLATATVLLVVLATLAYGVWNFGHRQGTTGSSLGKSIVGIRVVSEITWQPIGFKLSLVRQLAHVIDAAVCYVGYLFPLWDPKRQTIADKIMTTVCVPL